MKKAKSMPVFTANYPAAVPGKITLMSTPERMQALPEYTGKGVVMAFVDSGFYEHPDLDKRVITYIDATTERIKEGKRFNKSAPYSWHGQMTSVIAAGNGKISGGAYRGIASNAELILIKVMTEDFQLKEADILRGLRWILGNLTRYKIDIVNLSVGGDFVSNDPDHPIHRAIRDLTSAGVVVVAATGNHDKGRVFPPASTPEAITVGGYNDHNTLDRTQWTGFHNNWGHDYHGNQKPDILAPAIWIASPILPNTEVDKEARWLGPLLQKPNQNILRELVTLGRTEFLKRRFEKEHPDEDVYAAMQEKIHAHKLINAHYQHVDGTSVAAPIVSSIIAQMLEVNPQLKPEQIRTILTKTATPLEQLPKEKQGSGAINAAEAVRSALRLKGKDKGKK
ncbi:MAG: S8 family serine peptidase [Aggregatilineales bacterium]